MWLYVYSAMQVVLIYIEEVHVLLVGVQMQGKRGREREFWYAVCVHCVCSVIFVS